ncbi:hypothetical protein LTS10_011726 [Elasticomyces elasticus]|nr:hypothetical protein LTS10_011726 [Elasticomyces elasticus]
MHFTTVSVIVALTTTALGGRLIARTDSTCAAGKSPYCCNGVVMSLEQAMKSSLFKVFPDQINEAIEDLGLTSAHIAFGCTVKGSMACVRSRAACCATTVPTFILTKEVDTGIDCALPSPA